MVYNLKEEGHFSISFKLRSDDNVVRLFNGYYDGSYNVLKDLDIKYKPLMTEYAYDFSGNDNNGWKIGLKQSSINVDYHTNSFFTRDMENPEMTRIPQPGDCIICEGFILKDNSGIPITVTGVSGDTKDDVEFKTVDDKVLNFYSNTKYGTQANEPTNTDISNNLININVDRVPDMHNNLRGESDARLYDDGDGRGTGRLVFIPKEDILKNKHSLYNQGYLNPLDNDVISDSSNSIEIDWTNLSRLCDCHETDVTDINENVENFTYWTRTNVPTDGGYGGYNVITNNGKITHKDINTFGNIGLEAPKYDKEIKNNLNGDHIEEGVQYDISRTLIGTKIYRNLNKTGEMTIDNDVWPLMVDKGTTNGENSLSHPLSPYIIAVRNSESDSSTFSSRKEGNGERIRQNNIESTSGNFIRGMNGSHYEYNDTGSYRYSWLNGSTIWSYPYTDNIENEFSASSFSRQNTIIENHENNYKTVVEEYIKQKHPFNWEIYLGELRWNTGNDTSFNWTGRNIYPYSNISKESKILPIFTSSYKSKNYYMNIIKSHYHCNNTDQETKLSRGGNDIGAFTNENKHRALFKGDKTNGETANVNYISFEPNNYTKSKKSIIIDDNNKIGIETSRKNGKQSILSFTNNDDHLKKAFEFNGDDYAGSDSQAPNTDLGSINMTDISNNHDMTANRKSTINHILKCNQYNYNYKNDISSNNYKNNEYYSITNNIDEKIYYKQSPIESLTASGNFYYHDISYGVLDISHNPHIFGENMNFKITNMNGYNGYEDDNDISGYFSMSISNSYDKIDYDVIPFCEQNKSLRVDGIAPNIINENYPITYGHSATNTKPMKSFIDSKVFNGFVYRVAFNLSITILSSSFDTNFLSVFRTVIDGGNHTYGGKDLEVSCKTLLLVDGNGDNKYTEIYFISPKKLDLEYYSDKHYFICFSDDSGDKSINNATVLTTDIDPNNGAQGCFPVMSLQTVSHTSGVTLKSFHHEDDDRVDSTRINEVGKAGLITETQVYRLEGIGPEITNLDSEEEQSLDYSIYHGSIISYNQSYGRLLHNIPKGHSLYKDAIYVVSINNKIFREGYGNGYDKVTIYRSSNLTATDLKLYKDDPIEIDLLNKRLKVLQLVPNIIEFSNTLATLVTTDEFNPITGDTAKYKNLEVNTNAIILRQAYNELEMYVFAKAEENKLVHSDNYLVKGRDSITVFTNGLTNAISSHNTFGENNVGTTVIPDTVTLYGVKKTGKFFTNDIVFSNKDGSVLTDASVNENQTWGVVTEMENDNDDVNIKVATLVKVRLNGTNGRTGTNLPPQLSFSTATDPSSNLLGRNSEIMIMDERLIYHSEGIPHKLSNLEQHVIDNHILANGYVISDKFCEISSKNYIYIFVDTRNGIFYGNGPVYINGLLIGEAVQISTKYDFSGNLYKLHNDTTVPYKNWSDEDTPKGPYPNDNNIDNYKVVNGSERCIQNLGDISSYFNIHLETMKIKLDNINYSFSKGQVITYMRNNKSEYSEHTNKYGSLIGNEMIIKKEFSLAKGEIVNDTYINSKNTDYITVKMLTIDMPVSMPKFQNYNYDNNTIGNLASGSLVDNYHFQYRNRTKYSLFNGMMAFKLRQEYVEAKVDNPQIDPSGSVGGDLDGSGHNVKQTHRYNRLYDLSFNGTDTYGVKFADSDIYVHDGSTVLDSGSEFWEYVELDLKDSMHGTEIILIDGSGNNFDEINKFNTENYNFKVFNDDIDEDNMMYIYIKYQTNSLYDISGKEHFNNPNYEHYIIENKKQWGWDLNTVLKISRHEPHTPSDIHNLYNTNISESKVIKMSNYYSDFSYPSITTTSNTKSKDSTFPDLKKYNDESSHYRNQLIKYNSKNKYDDLITFYGYDHPQLGRNKRGMVIDSNLIMKENNTEQLDISDNQYLEGVNHSMYTYNPYNVLDMQWSRNGNINKNNTLDKNIDSYNAGQVTYLGSAEAPKFGSEMRNRPIKIKGSDGSQWKERKTHGEGGDNGSGSNPFEREFTVSFNSKTVANNYNNIRPTTEQKYREESIYSGEFELYSDMYQNNFGHVTNSDNISGGSPLHNCEANFIYSNTSRTNFDNITSFYSTKFNGDSRFNNYNERKVTLLDDSVFRDVSANLINNQPNLAKKYININTIRGLKDLSGINDVNTENASVFVFNNSYDAINAAKMFTHIRKLNKLTNGNTINDNGPTYKDLTSELYKHEIYPVKGRYNKNNWILFYFGNNHDGTVFDQSGVCIYLRNSKFTKDVINRQTVDNSLMLRNKKMMVFLHYMNNTADNDYFIQKFYHDGSSKFYNSFLRNKFRSIKSIVEIGTVPLSLMTYRIGSSLGNTLVEQNKDNIQFNENTFHTNSIFVNKTIEPPKTKYNISGKYEFDWTIGTTQQINIMPKNNTKYWTIQAHSNFWSHGLEYYYGIGTNTGEGASTVDTTVIDKDSRTYGQWSLQKSQEQINKLRTPRLYFKFGDNNIYPSPKQTDSGKDPWNEPLNSLAFISADPENETGNDINNQKIKRSTGTGKFSNIVPGTDTEMYNDIPVKILNNFTGQHKVISDLIDEEEHNYIGYIVSSIGKTTNYKNNKKVRGKNGIHINEALPEVELSEEYKDNKVIGVISGKEDENDEYRTSLMSGGAFKHYVKKDINRLVINSLGEGGIIVCNKNGNFENGDYICTSELPGIGCKQDDDIKHSYTVGKITMACNFSLNSNEYHCSLKDDVKYAFVSCTYHCG